MCRNQVVESTDYASFNVIGLVVILSVGTIAIILSIFDERVCRLLARHSELNEYRQASWEKNELLELQATALQELQSRASSKAASFGDLEESKTPRSVEKGPFD